MRPQYNTWNDLSYRTLQIYIDHQTNRSMLVRGVCPASVRPARQAKPAKCYPRMHEALVMEIADKITCHEMTHMDVPESLALEHLPLA